ncbi:MAG: hypothetical protein HZB75_02965 [Candidatus Saccharibacteria bacterium]|jgi:hypothetical protein|nr:MAG: hypothetical protein HZB75_02965 [Candidatus Saccharibacteria bacterium]
MRRIEVGQWPTTNEGRAVVYQRIVVDPTPATADELLEEILGALDGKSLVSVKLTGSNVLVILTDFGTTRAYLERMDLLPEFAAILPER